MTAYTYERILRQAARRERDSRGLSRPGTATVVLTQPVAWCCHEDGTQHRLEADAHGFFETCAVGPTREE